MIAYRELEPMVRRTELYIPVKQLTKLSFSCESCNATIVIDIADAKQRKELQEDITDKWCSACGERIERTIYESLVNLIQWYQTAKDLKADVHFVVGDEEERS
jgi:transcription elongation factor Elf1